MAVIRDQNLRPAKETFRAVMGVTLIGPFTHNLEVVMHVKQMLAKAKSDSTITPVEARDAMLGCFVSIHGETLKRGAQLLGKPLNDEQVEQHATVVMKSLLGSQWDQPTRESLKAAKVRMDQKMNFSQAPQDLRDAHDQVCSLIVSKV